ncbi:MAG TPA: LptA/OstA family protein [Nitrospira sp.]|nr:LptA/OstA family protein [Nitrospira sp.]
MLPWLLLPSAFVAGMSLLSGLASAAPAATATDSPVGTTITSKRMTVKNQESQAIFEGSVVLTRGTLIVYSDRMVVSFGPQEPANGTEERKVREAAQRKGPETVGNRSVNKIEATGRVKIERESGNATCERAVYYREQDKIVLTGSPVAWEKGTRVSGKQITMFLTEDRSVVEGGSHVQIEPEGGSR